MPDQKVNVENDPPPDMGVARRPQTIIREPDAPVGFTRKIKTVLFAVLAAAALIAVLALVQKCKDTLIGYQ